MSNLLEIDKFYVDMKIKPDKDPDGIDFELEI